MLAAINYEDIGVVDEFMCGTSLAGAAPATGLWPAKFTPATMSVGELHDTATRERAQAIEFAHPTSTRPSCPSRTWSSEYGGDNAQAKAPYETSESTFNLTGRQASNCEGCPAFAA